MKIVHTADREIIPGSGCPYIPTKHRMTPKQNRYFLPRKTLKPSAKIFSAGRTLCYPLHFRQCVLQIAGNAFADGAALKSILLPDDLLYIGAETFSGCRSLTKVSAILQIDPKAFAGSAALFNRLPSASSHDRLKSLYRVRPLQ